MINELETGLTQHVIHTCCCCCVVVLWLCAFFSCVNFKQRQTTGFVPANRILIKSNGCKMSVDVTPPEKPATKCSYRMVENRVVFRVEPFVFIAAIVSRSFVFFVCWTLVCARFRRLFRRMELRRQRLNWIRPFAAPRISKKIVSLAWFCFVFSILFLSQF